MLVNRALSYGASSRKGNRCFMVLPKKSSYKVIGCPNLTNILIVYAVCADLPCQNNGGMSIRAFHLGTHFFQCLQHNIHIPNIRQILYRNFIFRKQSPCNNAECSVLRSSYGNFSVKGISSPHDENFIHDQPQLIFLKSKIHLVSQFRFVTRFLLLYDYTK